MKETHKLKGNFTLLSLDKIKIIIPQSDVGQASYLSATTKWYKHPIHKGVFLSNDVQDSWFVGVSDELRLLEKSFDDRFIVLPLISNTHKDKKQLLWTWQSVQILINEELEFVELPAFISQNQSPILNYVMYNNEIIYHCDTEKLINYALNEISL